MSNNVVETIEHNGHTIEIWGDEYPFNPREEYDHFATMVCFHKRYNLGDKKHGYNENHYNSWQSLEADIYKNEKPVVCYSLYMYEHSGITISLNQFSCPWDSGQIGFIFVSREKALKEYGVKRITKKIKEKIIDNIKAEVEEYDSYLRGEVYGFTIYNKQGDQLDSCGGFLGDIKYCIDSAKDCTPDVYEEQLEIVMS